MKRSGQILFVLLMTVTIAAMFLPLATFEESLTAASSAGIEKSQEKLVDLQRAMDRYVKNNDTEKMTKQQAKIDKEQAKLDELLAEAEVAAAQEGGGGETYAMLPNAVLPQRLSFDQTRINEARNYQPNDGQYVALVYASAAMLLVSLGLFLLGGVKDVSKYFTFSSVFNLAAVVTLVYCILRLKAFPIQQPFSDAKLTWVQYVLILAPIIALAVNIAFMHRTKRTMLYVLLTFLSILSLLPFWIMIVNATRSTYEIQQGMSLLPSSYFQNNLRILTSKNFDVMVGFRNSAIIAFGSTILGVYFSALTAYALTVYQFKGSKQLYKFILLIIMIPTQVTATGFYMSMYRMDLTNSFAPLIIPAIASPSTVFFMKQYLAANFQLSLVEAARIDGSGEFFTYNRIVMPIMVPALATMGIMAVIGSWNNYLTPLMLLSNPDMRTLPMMVKELRGDIYRTEYGSIYLGLALTALPLILVYFALSKYIIQGIAVGGVKE
ncbi:MAG: carbohydrate ABC transporter permease [Candidatus Limiplasma sp.]|nr:carbohydrate ABC transporter permease [Candidatus Limiplasma sp.]